jgi:hypothetical protein
MDVATPDSFERGSPVPGPAGGAAGPVSSVCGWGCSSVGGSGAGLSPGSLTRRAYPKSRLKRSDTEGGTRAAHACVDGPATAAGDHRRKQMAELKCPWCEEQLPADVDPAAQEGSCPDCLTSWTYVDEPATGMAAAA